MQQACDRSQEIFDKAFVLKRLKNLYKKGPLEEQLQATYGADTDLGSPDLMAGLSVTADGSIVMYAELTRLEADLWRVDAEVF